MPNGQINAVVQGVEYVAYYYPSDRKHRSPYFRLFQVTDSGLRLITDRRQFEQLIWHAQREELSHQQASYFTKVREDADYLKSNGAGALINLYQKFIKHQIVWDK